MTLQSCLQGIDFFCRFPISNHPGQDFQLIRQCIMFNKINCIYNYEFLFLLKSKFANRLLDFTEITSVVYTSFRFQFMKN